MKCVSGSVGDSTRSISISCSICLGRSAGDDEEGKSTDYSTATHECEGQALTKVPPQHATVAVSKVEVARQDCACMLSYFPARLV